MADTDRDDNLNQPNLDPNSINLKGQSDYQQFLADKSRKYFRYHSDIYLDRNWEKYSFYLESPKLKYEYSEHAVWSGQNPAFPFSYWATELQGRFSRDYAERIDRALSKSRVTGTGFLFNYPGYDGIQGEAKDDFLTTPSPSYRILRWRSPNSFYIMTFKKYSRFERFNEFLQPGDMLSVMGELKQVTRSMSVGLLTTTAYSTINLVLVSFVPGIRISDPRILHFSDFVEPGAASTEAPLSNAEMEEFKNNDPELYAFFVRYNICILEDKNQIHSLEAVDTQRRFKEFDYSMKNIKHLFSVPFVPDFSKTNHVWYDDRGCGHVHLNLREMI